MAAKKNSTFIVGVLVTLLALFLVVVFSSCSQMNKEETASGLTAEDVMSNII